MKALTDALTHPMLALVGEAPGEQEERQSRPFVGPSGDEMNKALVGAGLRRGNIHVTNVLLCRPPDNKLTEFLKTISKRNREMEKDWRDKCKTAEKSGQPLPQQPQYIKSPIDCCRPRLEGEIENYRNFITLGKTANQAITGSSASILSVRGGLTTLPATERTPERKVMPTIHPSFCLHQPRWFHVFRNDISKAARWFRGDADWQPPKVTYQPTPDKLEVFLSRKDVVYAFDIETDGIESLTARIRCIAIGDGEEVYVIGFLSKDGLSRFYEDPLEERDVLHVIKNFLQDSTRTKYGWNSINYDATVIKQQWGVDVNNHIDGILIHRNVESELPHSLAYAVSMCTEAPAWKTDRDNNKIATMAESDDALHLYCATDTHLTAKILKPLVEQLKLRDQVHVWKFDQRVQEVCRSMHRLGMFVNQEVRLAKEKELLARLHKLLHQIRAQIGDDRFNPGSVLQMRDILFEKWKLNPPLEEEERLTSSGDPSTSDLVLRALLTDPDVPTAQRETIKLIRYYRKVQKVLGTYVCKLRPWDMAADLGWDEEEDWADKETREKYGEVKRGIVDPRTGRMHPGWSASVAVCVHPDTWILTQNGPIQIGRLQGFGPAVSEREVVGLKLHDGTSFAEVSHLQNPGVCSTLKIKTRLGFDLIATPHHRVRVVADRSGKVSWTRSSFIQMSERDANGRREELPRVPDTTWCRMDRLKEGMYLHVPIGMDVWGTNTAVPPCTPNTAVPPCTPSAVELPKELTEDLAFFVGVYNANGTVHENDGTFSIRLSNKKRVDGWHEVERVARCLFGEAAVCSDGLAVVVTHEALNHWINALGLKRGIVNRCCPPWLLSAPKNFVLTYLRGLFIKGHMYLNEGKKVWRFIGTKSLAQEVQMLLINLGIVASLSSRNKDLKRMRMACFVFKEDVQKVLAVQAGESIPHIDVVEMARRNFVRRGNNLYLPVSSVEDGGMQQVYDVTIPTTHQFWANGTVSHNTGRLSSSRPINAMNFPSSLRGMVNAAPGNVLVGADSEQIEVRIAASLWDVELYLKAFGEGKDVHSMNAYTIFGDAFCKAAGIEAEAFTRPGMLIGKSWDEKGTFCGKGESKALRSLGKAVFLASQYMAGVEKAAQMIRRTEVAAKDATTGETATDGTTDLPYALLPVRKVREMRERWLKGVPQYERGWNREIEEWNQQGFLADPVLGRRRDFLDGENPNELVNYKIQCLRAGSRVLTNRGLVPIEELSGQHFMAWTGKKWAQAAACEKGTASLYRVTTSRGFECIGDASHKLKFVGEEGYEWRSVGGVGSSALKVGDRVAFDLAQAHEFGEEVIADEIVGLLVSQALKTVSAGGSVPESIWRGCLALRNEFISRLFVVGTDHLLATGRRALLLSLATLARSTGLCPLMIKDNVLLLRDRESSETDIYDYDEIASISPLGDTELVYTLSVDDDDHQYVADGFIHANSAAAGLISTAMVQIYEQIPEGKWGPGTGIINQCHDHIVVECPESEAAWVSGVIEEAMNTAHPDLPNVRFAASAAVAKSWDKV